MQARDLIEDAYCAPNQFCDYGAVFPPRSTHGISEAHVYYEATHLLHPLQRKVLASHQQYVAEFHEDGVMSAGTGFYALARVHTPPKQSRWQEYFNTRVLKANGIPQDRLVLLFSFDPDAFSGATAPAKTSLSRVYVIDAEEDHPSGYAQLRGSMQVHQAKIHHLSTITNSFETVRNGKPVVYSAFASWKLENAGQDPKNGGTLHRIVRFMNIHLDPYFVRVNEASNTWIDYFTNRPEKVTGQFSAESARGRIREETFTFVHKLVQGETPFSLDKDIGRVRRTFKRAAVETGVRWRNVLGKWAHITHHDLKKVGSEALLTTAFRGVARLLAGTAVIMGGMVAVVVGVSTALLKFFKGPDSDIPLPVMIRDLAAIRKNRGFINDMLDPANPDIEFRLVKEPLLKPVNTRLHPSMTAEQKLGRHLYGLYNSPFGGLYTGESEAHIGAHGYQTRIIGENGTDRHIEFKRVAKAVTGAHTLPDHPSLGDRFVVSSRTRTLVAA